MDYLAISLRSAIEEDLPFLLELRQQTMDKYLLASGLRFSVQEHMQRALYRFDCAQIIHIAGEAVGLLKVSRDGKAWCLIQIQLKPTLHGRGLGTQLIQAVI